MISRRSLLLAAPALILPRRSLAHSKRRPWGGGGTSGGGGYHASAVQFPNDYSAYLSSSGLVGVSNTGLLTWGVWLNSAVFNAGADIFSPNTSTYNVFINMQSAPTSLEFQAPSLTVRTASGLIIGTWMWFGGCVNTNLSAGNKIVHMFLGDTDITNSFTDSGAAFLMAFAGIPWAFPDVSSDSPNYVGGVADPWWAPEQFLDLTVTSNRRKFIDASGKPVYLGANGELPTGTAPAVFNTGDITTFATNLGTGGPTPLTGVLTNATTSPSD